MSDIVERLRNGLSGAMLPAAEEIERLTKAIDIQCQATADAADEIERLRADLQFAYENKSASDDTWRKECELLRIELKAAHAGLGGLQETVERLLAEIEQLKQPKLLAVSGYK